ncbi:type II toxin-antitoxin system TacA family antitoxin [Calothrix sp. 336/3]|uniref:type II toxin-antitoxin system TacA family antitoxin n=1 Tax=Calothrix sp. 336/3 TaxID=1337936 RepID=UPI0004E3D397|nr:DUF1778 domain-containing protein [Calothrix sp. 336/3]AKG21001.1 hypothetical protein IJ00_06545 [Calothrix sp. 336/3]
MQPNTAASKQPNRDFTINIRVQQGQRDLIDRAAAAVGKSRSDFILETACREAETVLLDRRLFLLDEQKFQEFIALLDTTPNPQLQKLLTTKAPWE